MLIGALPWWGWSLILFGFTTLLGIIAVIAGVGGGVLYVPIVSALFPFHLDFVRGAGLMVALTGALSAGPHLLRSGLASLRLALPFALIGSVGATLGALVGFALPESALKLLLGIAIFGIVTVMVLVRGKTVVGAESSDKLSRILRIAGSYREETTGQDVNWGIHRTPAGLALFALVGFPAGLFGLGAGWANVPALHLVLSAPLKIAVATSSLILTVSPSAASWVYFHNGALLSLVVIPSVLGMMIGTRIGARILPNVKPRFVKTAVIVILLVAAIRQILDGAGIWQ